jgi:hypothetical protein
MSTDANRLILGTNKGLLVMEKNGRGWEMTCEAHRGARVSHATVDPRNGTLWALLDHGHWGTKLQRSKDYGASWEEVPAPAFPEGRNAPQALRRR